MKVVINKCYGGFGLSHKAVMEYAKLKGITLYPHIDDTTKRIYGDRATLDNPAVLIHYTTIPWEEYEKLEEEDQKKPIEPGRFEKSGSTYFHDRAIARNDLDLVKTIETLGGEANGMHAELEIIEIPDDVKWVIGEYDGVEWVAEKHRTWR